MTGKLGQPVRHGRLRLYSNRDGAWTVSDNGMWLPGVYDTKEAAIAAADLPDEVLENTLRPICFVDGQNRAITMADVEKAREER